MNLPHNAVCITGIGATTSVGLDAVATAASVRAGISGFQEHLYMINQEGDPYVLAMVPSIDPNIIGVKRYIELITPSIIEALTPLQHLSPEQREINVKWVFPLLKYLLYLVARGVLWQANRKPAMTATLTR